MKRTDARTDEKRSRPTVKGSVRRVLFAALALAVIGGLALAYVLTTRGVMTGMTVADLFADRAIYEDRLVSMELAYGRRNETDPLPAEVSRSDAFLHDDTGTILLSGGWQIWAAWQSESAQLRSDAVEIDADGGWHVKKAIVRYSDEGYPYLELPEDGD